MKIVTCIADNSNKRDWLDPAPRSCYSGSVTNPNLEKLVDRSYTRRRSRIVDQRVEWLDREGFTSKGVGQ